MGKTALLSTRDTSGLAGFSTILNESFGYRLLRVESVVEEGFESVEPVDFEKARELLETGEVSLVVANFLDPVAVGRKTMSWRKALDAFDHEIVHLIRLAARTPQSVTILGNPESYEAALSLISDHAGFFPPSFRIEQACNALYAVSKFDTSVAQYLENQSGEVPDLDALGGFPKTLNTTWKRARSIGSGESPHQKAGLYGTFRRHFETVHGPEIDYRAIVDSSLATFAIGEFEKTTAVITQRGELLSAASADVLGTAIHRAIDSVSFDLSGATLAVNGSMDVEGLTEIDTERFATLIAPGFVRKEALDGVRLLESREGLGYEALQELRSVVGGVLVQDRNRSAVNPFAWKMPSANQPLVTDWESMIFGVKISRHLRSAACAAVRNERVVALASGLVHQGRFAKRLGEDGVSLEGAILVFDEDIVDSDSLGEAHKLGCTVVVHPGRDSSREGKLLAKANQLGLALVTTGVSFTKY